MKQLTDAHLIDSAIGTLKRFGFNADRGNFDMILTVAMEDARDGNARLDAIRSLTDLTINHGLDLKAFLDTKQGED